MGLNTHCSKCKWPILCFLPNGIIQLSVVYDASSLRWMKSDHQMWFEDIRYFNLTYKTPKSSPSIFVNNERSAFIFILAIRNIYTDWLSFSKCIFMSHQSKFPSNLYPLTTVECLWLENTRTLWRINTDNLHSAFVCFYRYMFGDDLVSICDFSIPL